MTTASGGVSTLRDLAFPTRDGHTLAFDLHLPVAQEPAPLVIYLHGGGWRSGHRRDFEATRQLSVARAGLAVASVEYRLSSAAQWPAQLDDVRDAIAAVPDIARSHGARITDDVSLWGSSAGGHLALMAALSQSARAAGSARVKAVVAWFAPTDLTVMGRAPKPSSAVMPGFVPAGAEPAPYERQLLGLGDSDADHELLWQASPVAHARADAAPILLVHGEDDALIPAWHSLELHRRIVAAGGRASTLLVSGATHEDAAIESPATLAATAQFLKTGAAA